MNPVALILNALKTWPEPYTLELDEAEPISLAELDSRLGEIRQVINELKKQVQGELAAKLAGRNLRYGDTIYRGVPTKGSARIVDDTKWWPVVLDGLMQSPRPVDLLAALYPASSVRLTALPKLAAALGVEYDELRKQHVEYAESSVPIQVMPVARAPMFLQTLEDGEVR